MFSNLSGSSYAGRPRNAAHSLNDLTKTLQSRASALASSLTFTGHGKDSSHAPAIPSEKTDRFEKRSQSSEPSGSKTPDTPDSDDEDSLERFLREIYAEASRQAEEDPLIIRPASPQPKPTLHRTVSFHEDNLPIAESAIDELELTSTAAVHAPLPIRLQASTPQLEERLKSLPVPEEERSVDDTRSSGPTSSRRHHRRLMESAEAAQAKIRARQVEADKVGLAGKPVGQAELMKYIRPKYSHVVMTDTHVRPNLNAEQTAEVMKSAKRVVVGDMHASFHKLVEMLVLADMVEMPAYAAKRFVELANQANDRKLDIKKLAQVERDLRRVVSTFRWTGGDRQLILMGDLLSDRGPLDSITMAIIRKLRNQAPDQITHLASNHDHNVLWKLMTDSMTTIPEQSTSMDRAIETADKNNDLDNLICRYFDHLSDSKLLYLDEKSKTLYAHAPISMKQLRDLQPLLGPDAPKIDEIKDLDGVRRFVKAANRFYSDYVEQNREVFQERVTEDFTKQMRTDISKDIALHERRQQVEAKLVGEDGFLWVRNLLDKKEDLPFHKAGVKALIHGHDLQTIESSPFNLLKGREKAPDFTVITLDQLVRKGEGEPSPEDLNMVYVQL